MKAVIEIIKRYLVEVLCGFAAVGGVVFIFLGLGGMGEIRTELEGAVRVKDEIVNMARGPAINERAVKQQEKRISEIRAGFDEVMTFVRERDYYEPLVKGAFPGGESSAADRNNAIAFRDVYQDKIDDWLERLNAGDVPSAADIAAERDRMEQQGDAPEDKAPDDGNDNAESGLRITPEVGAAIAIARSISCYANPASFQSSAVSAPDGPMDPGRPPPKLEEMWHAQLELWVQESVVDAIAAVNHAAANELESGDSQPWVGNLPIKDLRTIQTTQYYVKEGLTQATAQSDKDRFYPPGKKESAFTGRESGDLYELMQFTVQLVVDAREIPRVLAGLCEKRFHVPLGVQYTAIAPNFEMEDKIYGDDPVVLLTIDFETVFFSELYLPLMPQVVLDQLGKTRPEPPEDAGA